MNGIPDRIVMEASPGRRRTERAPAHVGHLSYAPSLRRSEGSAWDEAAGPLEGEPPTAARGSWWKPLADE